MRSFRCWLILGVILLLSPTKYFLPLLILMKDLMSSKWWVFVQSFAPFRLASHNGFSKKYVFQQTSQGEIYRHWTPFGTVAIQALSWMVKSEIGICEINIREMDFKKRSIGSSCTLIMFHGTMWGKNRSLGWSGGF